MDSNVRVAIFENYSLFSFGLRSVLTSSTNIEITFVAATMPELMKSLTQAVPAVLIFDVLHNHNGTMRNLQKISRKFPGLPIIILTSMQYADCFTEYVKIGVKGFVFENETPEDLLKAIKKVNAGGNYLPAEMQKWLKEIAPSGKRNGQVMQKRNHLTEREISILKLFCQGLTYKEIGRKLFISPRTVETHKKNILAKLRLKTTAEMIKYAFHNHLIV